MSRTITVHRPVRSAVIEHAMVFPDINEISVTDLDAGEVLQDSRGDEQPAGYAVHSEEAQCVEDHSVEIVNIEELVNTARHEGFEQGYQAARNDIENEFSARLEEIKRHELEPYIRQLSEFLTSLHQQWKYLSKKIEDAVVTLSLTVAQQIIKVEVSTNGMVIVNQAREAIRHLAGVERLRIRIHPEDEALLKQFRAELIAASDAVKEIIIEADEHVARGGCILESESGNIDATLETQFRKISDLLMSDHELSA
ncbi:MAG: flagellar assembly protein FliH [Bacteroidetes bacterium]|nr:flagellar assembly protein FliH [Bacteroidota bacterium]